MLSCIARRLRDPNCDTHDVFACIGMIAHPKRALVRTSVVEPSFLTYSRACGGARASSSGQEGGPLSDPSSARARPLLQAQKLDLDGWRTGWNAFGAGET